MGLRELRGDDGAVVGDLPVVPLDGDDEAVLREQRG